MIFQLIHNETIFKKIIQKKKDIQNYDPQFTKPVDEKKTISFHNVKDNDSNNIDSDSRTISNDNENAAPSIRNNLHRNFK